MIEIYTDGACSGNPGPGGWAAVVTKNQKLVEVLKGPEGYTTNNRMEIMAMARALYYVSKMKKQSNVNIYSDSALVINSITKGWLNNWEKNDWIKSTDNKKVMHKDLWKKIFKAIEKIDKLSIQVSFIKIKGHSGDTFNEMADQHAKDGYLL